VPPVDSSTISKTAGDDPGGMGNQFGPGSEHLGSSFREAHWCKNRKYIAGIMRGDEGETLVVICQSPSSTAGSLDDGQPHGIIKGEHIDMSVDPTSGNIAYSVDDFRFVDPAQVPPSIIKNGKVVKPFRNILGLLNLDDQTKNGAIFAWQNGARAFAEPQISPDGSQVVFVVGSDRQDGFKSYGLVVAPFGAGGGKSGKMLASGMVGSPCWSPDGKQIAFVVINADGHSDIDVIPAEGGTPKVVTAGKGSFSSPHFSPMTPKPGS
jgi:hypothetical protein